MVSMRNRPGLVAALVAFTPALTETSAAAPPGPPVRVGGTLVLTGPFAATALFHKIPGEIYVDELNRCGELDARVEEIRGEWPVCSSAILKLSSLVS